MSHFIRKRLGLQVDSLTRSKKQAGNLAYILYLQSIEKNSDGLLVTADRVAQCSSVWTGFKCPECGRLHGMMTYGCKHRLCPLCSVRKSRAVAAQAMQVIESIQRKYADLDYHLLTLTQRNVSAEQLPDEIDRLLNAWSSLRFLRLVRRDLIGWARTIEITVGSDGTYHPHIHAILLLKKGSPLSTQAAWRALWKESLHLQYEPICDCRPLSDTAAVYEVSKYVTKVSKVLGNPNLGQCYDDVDAITTAVYGRRLRSYGGIWAKERKALRMVDVDTMDDGQLSAVGNMIDGHEKCECGADVEAVCLIWSGMEYKEAQMHAEF